MSLEFQHDKLVCVGKRRKSYMGANFVDLIASTNGRMHVHATALPARCKTLAFQHRSTFTSVLSLGRALLVLFLRCYSHARARARARTSRARTQSPPTHMHAGCCRLCRCVSSICFQHRLLSCQCADSDFSTLSDEMRDGDAGVLQ